MADNDEPRWVELTNVFDPIQAELLAVFLDNSDLEFRMLGMRSAPVLAALIPGAQEPVLFEVPEGLLELGRELLTEYQLVQSREFVPSEFPPPYEEDETKDEAKPDAPGNGNDTPDDNA